jgi:hypothetical protein
VRAASWPEAVTVLREARVESGLQYLQHGLLDEPVERSRDAKLSHPTATLGNLPPQHRFRLVRAREQLLANTRPSRLQVRRELFHGHAVDAGTALVPLHPLQRRPHVVSLDHQFHQVAVSRALVSIARRRSFAAPSVHPGFTQNRRWWPRLRGLLAPGSSEIHGRFALLSVWPFALLKASGPPGVCPGRLLRRYYGRC